MNPPRPDDEAGRLEELRRYDILDTDPEEVLDDLTLLAAHICDAPIALITLVDEHRQWFKSKLGLTLAETPRDVWFCAHAILQPDLLIVRDTLKDERFATNPLVTSDPYIRFYAGAPLVTPSGHALGTLCVVDLVPRDLSADDQQALRVLSRRVTAQLELRRGLRQLARITGARDQAPETLPLADDELAIRVRERVEGLVRTNAAMQAELAERKRAEEELRRTTEHFRSLIENALDIITILDGTGSIRYESPSLERVLGFKPEELLGQNAFDYVHAEDRQSLFEVFAQTVQRAGPSPLVQFRFRHKDGSWRILEAIGNNAPAASGAAMVVVNSRDITERKRAEEELRRSEERYRSLIESARDAIVTLAPDGTITSVNSAFEAITGSARVPWIGQPFVSLLHPEDVPRALETFRRVLQGDLLPILELRLRTRATDYAIGELTVTPQVQDGRTVGVLVIARDITDRKRLEEQFLQAQRVEAVGRLTGGVAHDFNNILVAITGYSEMLLKSVGPDPLSRRYLGEIRRAADRAASLTRQLLAFSTKQVLLPVVLDLNAVVLDMEAMFRRLIGEDVELTSVLADDVGLVRADPGQIEQVLLNLAVNARDAMPNGGQLIIQTSNVTVGPERTLEPEQLLAGRYVMLAVRDTGVGMAPEVKRHILEPFFTTKPRGQGTGLGLATSYGIIRQSGGYITVDSEPGQGTTFNIYLPCVEQSVEVMARREESGELPHGSETVLLVEDEPAVLELVGVVLRELGYRVFEAPNGVEALRLAQGRDGCDFDLLLTDVVMPRMSGKELAEQLRATRPDTKVLFTSGYAQDALGHQEVLDAKIAYLQKPFTTAALVRKVRELLDGKR